MFVPDGYSKKKAPPYPEEPGLWETRPPVFGAPGLLLPMPLARVAAQYPINPEWLGRMAEVPITESGPRAFGILPVPGYASYDPLLRRLYLPQNISAETALHEYGHAMEPLGGQGFAPAYKQAQAEHAYPPATAFYEAYAKYGPLVERLFWELQKSIFPSAVQHEAYAEYPRLNFAAPGTTENLIPIPRELRQYYPWLRFQ